MINRVQRGYNNGGGCILNILSKKKNRDYHLFNPRTRWLGWGVGSNCIKKTWMKKNHLMKMKDIIYEIKMEAKYNEE